MYRQLANSGYRNHVAAMAPRVASLAESGQLDVLVALERIGTQLSFSRNEEIYTEGDSTECWYKISPARFAFANSLPMVVATLQSSVSAAMVSALMVRANVFSAEAVGDVIVIRFSRKATEQMIDQNPALARMLRETMLHDLTNVYNRLLLLGRMTATERVATFLIELFERRDRKKTIVVPMSRNDIADYVCLTIETVCRVLSTFKRDGIIAIPNAHSVELPDSRSFSKSCRSLMISSMHSGQSASSPSASGTCVAVGSVIAVPYLQSRRHSFMKQSSNSCISLQAWTFKVRDLYSFSTSMIVVVFREK